MILLLLLIIIIIIIQIILTSMIIMIMIMIILIMIILILIMIIVMNVISETTHVLVTGGIGSGKKHILHNSHVDPSRADKNKAQYPPPAAAEQRWWQPCLKDKHKLHKSYNRSNQMYINTNT